ncbi:MAG TPA: extracellular matrix/biofilm biosynthesis regulator RemA family protein [Thermomicrobiales bacterium]|nr:extracellular matrix/biofilm biosynthesis regulator RemA family protein [Thermomicrobiales bacterium]
MRGEFVHVGFGAIVATERILAIVSPDSEPLRRLIATARQEGRLIDATHGRRTKALLVFDTGQLMTAALHPETLLLRVSGGKAGGKGVEERTGP